MKLLERIISKLRKPVPEEICFYNHHNWSKWAPQELEDSGEHTALMKTRKCADCGLKQKRFA
jgi:hypothetical protein